MSLSGESTGATSQETQGDIDREIADLAADYRMQQEKGLEEESPRLDYVPYRSSIHRHPKAPLVRVNPEQVELHAPVFGERDVARADADLTIGGQGQPIGERISVTGRVMDSAGRPVAHQLIEIWQANAAGRYHHMGDQHPAPLDPNFTGAGRCLTGADGTYRFETVKPGPYPWRNHLNAWRPAHIHFSLFGTAFTHRLITQMYFPGDPLQPLDPIYQSIRDVRARERLVATYAHELSVPEFSLGYRWDIVVGGPSHTWSDGDT